MKPFYEQADINHPNTWTQQVLRDFQEITGDLQDERTGGFKSLFQRMRGKSVRMELQRTIKARRKKKKHIQEMTWKMQKPQGPTEQQATARDEFVCYRCGKSFQSRTALGAHGRTAYGTFSRGAGFAPTSQCFACMTEFHTRKRLVQHLEYGTTKCLDYLAARIEPLLSFQIEALNRADAEARRETNSSGRRTGDQKKVHIREATEHIEDIAGKWQGYLDLLNEDERAERDLLECWSEETLVDLFLQADTVEKMIRVLHTAKKRADELEHPINVLFLFHHLAHDLSAQFPQKPDLDLLRVETARIRNELLLKWQE